MKVVSRVGLWGAGAGFAALWLAVLFPETSSTIAPASGFFGFVSGGVGTIATAVLVLRRRREKAPRVFAASVAGIPLGFAMIAVGLDALTAVHLPPAYLTLSVRVIAAMTILILLLVWSGVWYAARATDRD